VQEDTVPINSKTTAEPDPDKTIKVGSDADPDKTIKVGSDADPDKTIKVGSDADPDKTIKVGSDADPDKTVKVNPNTSNADEMATRVGPANVKPDAPTTPEAGIKQTPPEVKSDLFEQDVGVKLLQNSDEISDILAKGKRGETLTEDELITTLDYLRSQRSLERGKLGERVRSNELSETDRQIIDLLNRISGNE